jgi:hypothetical protein
MWDGAIRDDKNGTDGVDVRLDLGLNALLVELVLLKAARLGQLVDVDAAKLGRRLHKLYKFTNTGTYHYAVLTGEFPHPFRGCPALVTSTGLLVVGVVENVEIVVINVVASNVIGDEFYG